MHLRANSIIGFWCARMQEERGNIQLSESLALKAVGLLLALILWVTILGFKREELKKAVKLEPLLPPGMMITNKVPSSILFTFTGPRVLLKDIERRLQPIRPDLRRTRDTTIGFSISEDLLGELPSGIRVVGFYPPNILIRLEELVEKKIKVHPTITGVLPVGYRLGKVVSTPDSVKVLGPKSLIESTTSLGTAPIDISSLKGSKQIDVEVDIDTEQGVQLTQERVVQVKVNINPSSPR
ncbi:MAG: YbbR-like domain-containing protein [Deltaproteobacteria bacterium]|nr:YbbR-like domain-containing protein [Deltaproteobacteria bacterium]MBI3294483.1 YbbR-like domain-containing protein [Deltaproteobacteria bacterium]